MGGLKSLTLHCKWLFLSNWQTAPFSDLMSFLKDIDCYIRNGPSGSALNIAYVAFSVKFPSTNIHWNSGWEGWNLSLSTAHGCSCQIDRQHHSLTLWVFLKILTVTFVTVPLGVLLVLPMWPSVSNSHLLTSTEILDGRAEISHSPLQVAVLVKLTDSTTLWPYEFS